MPFQGTACRWNYTCREPTAAKRNAWIASLLEENRSWSYIQDITGPQPRDRREGSETGGRVKWTLAILMCCAPAFAFRCGPDRR